MTDLMDNTWYITQDEITKTPKKSRSPFLALISPFITSTSILILKRGGIEVPRMLNLSGFESIEPSSSVKLVA